jgi:hypothetical protein
MKELYERSIFEIVEFENEDIVTGSPDPTVPSDDNETPEMPV